MITDVYLTCRPTRNPHLIGARIQEVPVPEEEPAYAVVSGDMATKAYVDQASMSALWGAPVLTRAALPACGLDGEHVLVEDEACVYMWCGRSGAWIRLTWTGDT